MHPAAMPRKPKPPQDDPAQSKRFTDMAREIEADEGETGRDTFERAFKKVVSHEAGEKKASS